MQNGFLFMLQRDTTVADACRMMTAHSVGIVAVLNGEEALWCLLRAVVDRRIDVLLDDQVVRRHQVVAIPFGHLEAEAERDSTRHGPPQD